MKEVIKINSALGISIIGTATTYSAVEIFWEALSAYAALKASIIGLKCFRRQNMLHPKTLVS